MSLGHRYQHDDTQTMRVCRKNTDLHNLETHILLSHLIYSGTSFSLILENCTLIKMSSVRFGFVSLLLAQVEIKDSADQEERDAQPRQDETVAKASFFKISGFSKNVLSVEGEDEASSKGCETCKNKTFVLNNIYVYIHTYIVCDFIK